jgi:2-polyprenyl-3-methyl-5-hydroxy-6-metoxy-1,4-benzoquinol methylase
MKNTKNSTGNISQNLENIAEYFTTYDGLDAVSNEIQYELFKPHFKGNAVLEVGSADGKTTGLLTADFKRIIAVDGSSKALENLKKKIKSDQIVTICKLFEEFDTKEAFNTIIMGHILEHVDNPVAILSRFNKFLSTNGRLLISVPNALSFHRLAAVKMGLLKDPYELNDTDRKKGHQRVYDRETLEKDVHDSGYKIIESTGYWLKFLNNTQILKNWNKQLIMTYMRLGNLAPDHTAELVIICTKK